MCFDAADHMIAKCKEDTGECKACALTIAEMFVKYERKVEMAIEAVFEEVKARREKDMQEARKLARGNEGPEKRA